MKIAKKKQENHEKSVVQFAMKRGNIKGKGGCCKSTKILNE